MSHRLIFRKSVFQLPMTLFMFYVTERDLTFGRSLLLGKLDVIIIDLVIFEQIECAYPLGRPIWRQSYLFVLFLAEVKRIIFGNLCHFALCALFSFLITQMLLILDGFALKPLLLPHWYAATVHFLPEPAKGRDHSFEPQEHRALDVCQFCIC